MELNLQLLQTLTFTTALPNIYAWRRGVLWDWDIHRLRRLAARGRANLLEADEYVSHGKKRASMDSEPKDEDVHTYWPTAFCGFNIVFFCGCHNYIERKSRSTKVRLFTVPCCSIIPVSSKRWGKNLNLLLFVLSFYNSCLCPSFVFPPYFAFTNVVL